MSIGPFLLGCKQVNTVDNRIYHTAAESGHSHGHSLGLGHSLDIRSSDKRKAEKLEDEGLDESVIMLDSGKSRVESSSKNKKGKVECQSASAGSEIVLEETRGKENTEDEISRLKHVIEQLTSENSRWQHVCLQLKQKLESGGN